MGFFEDHPEPPTAPHHEVIQAARHLLWKHDYEEYAQQPGGFHSALIDAMSRADVRNRYKLVSAFPEYNIPVHIMTTEGGNALIKWLDRRIP